MASPSKWEHENSDEVTYSLYEKHELLAFSTLKIYSTPRWCELGDLETAAMVGLYKAARKWDPKGPTLFRSLAITYIRNEIRTTIRNLKQQFAEPVEDMTLGIVQELRQARPSSMEETLGKRQLLDRALQKVPAKHRKTFYLAAEGYTVTEIAPMIGMKAASCQTRFADFARMLQRDPEVLSWFEGIRIGGSRVLFPERVVR